MTAQAAATGSGRQSHGTPSGSGTGFCRVTVVAPDSRVDVALPEDIPVADLYP
ncbi:EsaB/YukD family protein, partial [Streptomyces anulatus]